MNAAYEAMTPLDIEAQLNAVRNEITRAQGDLRAARIAETKAKVALKRAEIVAAHDVPPVKRGSDISNADARKEAIFERCVTPWQELEQATTLREIAQEALRVKLADAEILRSLGSSVRASYEMAGRG